MFENAKWITDIDWKAWYTPGADRPQPYFVRDFDIKAPVSKVTLNICGLGQGVYYLNGDRLPNTVHPTQRSAYNKSAIYNTYDLTDSVKSGINRLGIILGGICLVDPEYSFRVSTPRMIAQLDIEYKNGETETIVSDTSFKCHPSPILFSLRRCGEKYDPRLEVPGWNLPETSTDAWDHAYICAGPGGKLRPVTTPPKKIAAEIPGKEIAPGLFSFDDNISGWVRIKIKGKHEEEVSVLYSEWLTEDGLHASTNGFHWTAYKEMTHRDVIYSDPDQEVTFEPLFSFHGFRYVEVTGATDVEVTAIKAHTDIKPLSSFECSNPILNKLHKACVNSILECCQGVMLDCPQREQNEWTGDGMLTSEVVSMEFDAYNMYYEWMKLFQDDQTADGHLSSIIPCRLDWPFNFANGLDFSSAMILIPYYMYKYTGNREVIDLMWDNMVLMMNYFKTRSENCLMDFGVGDWVSIDNPRCKIEVTDTLWYRQDALAMAELARVTGRDASEWEALAEEIRRQFREKYMSDGQLTDRHFTTLIGSVYTGILTDDEIQSHVDAAAQIVINDNKSFKCGVHGLRMLFDVFGRYGYNDLIFDVLTNEKELGYAKSLLTVPTTLVEQFNFDFKENPQSLNHHFMATVSGWFFRIVAGINVDGFGWDTLRIAPYAVENLKEFTATVRGITVKRQDSVYYISSPIPFKLELGSHSGNYDAGEYTFTI